MAMAAASPMKDVALLYHDDDADNEKAAILRAALERLELSVSSHDDFDPTVYELQNQTSQIEHALYVVLIVTDDFLNDAPSEFGTYASLSHSIRNGLSNVIHVTYTENIPLALSCFTDIKGSLPPDQQARKIKTTVENHKEKAIKIEQYQSKAQLILNCVMDILRQEYDIENKMKQLHQTMEDKIGNDPTSDIRDGECSCCRGELWKKEISDEKYWAVRPEPFRSIKKAARPDDATKHTADVHKLYEPHGYMKLASVFLFKRPTPDHSNITTLYGYLDHDGLLQLLQRCTVFDISKEKRGSIEKLRDARNNVAHIPAELTTAEKEDFLATTIDLVKKGCYDLLSHDNWELLCTKVKELRQATLTATVQRQPSTNPDEGPFNNILRSFGNLNI